MATDNKPIIRATGLLVILVQNSNPNGDPDRESDPRTRSHDQRGVPAARRHPPARRHAG